MDGLKEEKHMGKRVKMLHLLLTNLNYFRGNRFSLTVHKKTCTEIERNTKEPTACKKFHSISGEHYLQIRSGRR